jgi:hypothetical protein
MDWKYKHFQQEKVFAAPRDVVLEAARTFFTESLRWKISDTADGFAGEGYSFMHRAIANCAIQPAAAGMKLIIDLQVERAGGAGFMLFDVGGYYTIQIRKWFDGIQWLVHQKQAGQDTSAGPPLTAHNKTTACIFNGCLGFIVAMFALWLVVNLIGAVIGLLTGTLYLWGKGGTLIVQGIWARIVSAMILALGAFLIWKIIYHRRPGSVQQP